jgi:hypothetical protein
MSNFHVGQKVVLVNDDKGGEGVPKSVASRYGAVFPAKGPVYTVRDIRYATATGEELLLLVELDNSHVCAPLGVTLEPGFAAYRFRPVAERKTDISCFTAMLEPKKARVNA